MPETRSGLEREQVASEARHWVRIARACNNRCAFCLDSDVQDGTLLALEEVEQEVRAGREQGAERLILSGGEASIHPDFLDLVRLGKALGYGHVQTITNGRMFAYRRFLDAALDAGLDEITFSLHGHTARLHDELTGVPGAFTQAVAGIRNAIASRRCIVSGDVVINRINVTHLRDVLDLMLGLGIREFDLLMVVPFGRASPDAGAELLFDAEEALPHLHRALELSRDPRLHVWTNRLDPRLLEGYEELIQDPHKLHDEIRGRRDILADLVAGRPMCCAGDRCAFCFIQPLCVELRRAVEAVSQGVPGALLVDAPANDHAELVRADRAVLWVRAADAAEAATLAQGSCAHTLWLELDDLRWLRRELARAGFSRPVRIVARDRNQAAHALRLAPPEVAIPVQRDTVSLLRGLPCPTGTHTALYLPFDLTLREATAHRIDLRTALHAAGADEWIGIPPCVSGAGRVRYLDPLPLSTLDATGRLDPDAFVDHFVRRLYRVKSLRCRSCRFDDRCRGIGIQLARLEGLALLEPVS